MNHPGIVLILSVLPVFGMAAAPRVVSTQPANGNTAVDAAAADLRIEFDQDMDRGGYSLCGGGPKFPNLQDQGYWESARVCVFPVQLEPGRDYELSINCPSAKRFRNVAGEPAIITPWHFTTSQTPGPAKSQTELNRAAVATLRRAIATRYSYRDRVVKDWSSLFSNAEPALVEASSPMEFARRAGQMLRAAQDGHLFLKVGETTVPSHTLDLRANGDPERLRKLVRNWKQANKIVASGRFPDDIGYILIASWEGNAAAFTPAHEALDSLATAKGLVLDMRFNSGGDERIAQDFAARFVESRTLFAQHRLRDPLAASGWSPTQRRFIEPVADANRRFKGRVAVLMGRRCFSSNETFLLMMRHGAKAKLIGERSYGSSGNPQPIDLRNGVRLRLPSWEALDAAGNLIEGSGITPDIAAVPGDDPAQDGVLDAALQWLGKNP
jgi:hypothetical protein